MKEKIVYFIGLFAVINLFLLSLILEPFIAKIRLQVEQGGVIETGQFAPIFHDYYYQYVLTDSAVEGEWQVDTYKELQTLVDENGQIIQVVETGNVQYIRYWIGN